jgi:rhodanese-related sulfurtransferase
MRHLVCLGAAATVLLAMPAWAQKSATPSETSPDVLKEKLENGERVLVIDVRSNEQSSTASIPGAIHIPMAQLSTRMKDVPKGVQIVFISNRGGRGSRAAKLFNRRGYVTATFSALNEWKVRGYATEPVKEAPPGAIKP